MFLLAFAHAHAEEPVSLPESAEEYRGHGGPRRGPPPRYHRRAHTEAPRAEHDVTLTIDLVDLPTPLLSAGVEAGLGRRVGVGVNGGVGFYNDGALYDLGAELRGYFLGDFDTGLYVSGGGGVTNLTPLTLGDQAATIEAALGGKYTLPFGFSADASIGVAYYGMPELGLVSPTARIGVGWSF